MADRFELEGPDAADDEEPAAVGITIEDFEAKQRIEERERRKEVNYHYHYYYHYHYHYHYYYHR